MARPNQEQIETFMSIAGVSEAIAIQKLEDHDGNLNQAVNSFFAEEERNRVHQASVAANVDDDDDNDDVMDIDDTLQSGPHIMNPFSVLDSNFPRNLINSGSDVGPTTNDVTGPQIHGPVIIDDEEQEVGPTLNSIRPTAPDYNNDIEEEMIRAAIEASKRDAEMSNEQLDLPSNQIGSVSQQTQSEGVDPEIAHALSLSLKSAEQEKALRESDPKVDTNNLVEEEMNLITTNGRQSRLEVGSSSIQEEGEDIEDEPLVRHRRRRVSSSGSIETETGRDSEEVLASPPVSPRPEDHIVQPPNGSDFPSEWGGISSEEHDEAVMLEAAMFGGVPEGPTYNNFRYTPHQFMNNNNNEAADRIYNTRHMPRPPSPSLTAQRLIREQQDDEYLASLQADREKEIKAKEEAEAAIIEEKRKEEEERIRIEKEQESERELRAKEASLPVEPTGNDENAVNLLVKMPDGTRRGRRFLKSNKLQCLFDYIDVGRVIKPGTYRVVRPYPRRAFGDGECGLSFSELGLTSKQEALFLELI